MIKRTAPLFGLAALAAFVLVSGCSGEAPSDAPERQSQADPESPATDAADPRTRYERLASIPDGRGTGAFPAIKYEDESLPAHVIYRPENPEALDGPLPIYLWGNGGCSRDGASARLHLLEVASHGYLVIASGTILNGPGVHIPDPLPDYYNGTTPEQMIDALDWAIAENQREGSALQGAIATDSVAVSGHSCGGLQAILSAEDPRVDTAVIMNSGIYNDEGPGRSGMVIKKAHLEKLHAPMLYILGGPSDMAYANGMDDFRRLGVPVVAANLDVGHGGTFWEPNGGKAAAMTVRWLDWRLKGDGAAAAMFLGDECGYCLEPDWEIPRRNFSAK